MTAEARPVRIVVAAIAAATVAAAALAGGTYSDFALGAATMIVWAVLAVVILAGAPGRRGATPALGAGAALLLALLALTVLSLSWTNSDESAFVEAVRLAGYLGLFLLVGLSARRSWTAPALRGIATAVVGVAVLALGSRLLGLGSADAELSAVLPTAGGRLSYTLGYWNALGALVALVLPILCWSAVEARATTARSLALAAFVPPLLAAFMTSSRGALIAVALGLAVTVHFAADRRRMAAAALVGTGAAVPAVIAATLAPGIIDSPGSGSLGGSEVAVLLALVVGVAAALLFGAAAADALAGARLLALRVRGRTVVAGIVAAAVALIALAGPSALVGDLRAGTDGADSDRAVGVFSASGSGRAQFWSAALDAFADQPVRGIGAGGFENYWNQNGSLLTPVRNAHSEPLELLAELGPLGPGFFASFILLVLVCGVRAARVERSGPAGAALGLVAAALVGFAIDWTWQVPAVVIPVLICAGFLAQVAPTSARARPVSPSGRSRALALGALALALPALWAGGVLAVASDRLDAGSEALARGQLDEAAAATREATEIEPWASGPWLQLAEIELAGDNLVAAKSAAAEAVARDRESFEPWLLVALASGELGERKVANAYAKRTISLRPQG